MEHGIDAGDFGAWLIQAREVLRGSAGSTVPCGDCTGCCTSSYSIEVRPADAAALERIPAQSLFRSLGSAAGNWTVRPKAEGTFSLICRGQATIYTQRPQTCLDYDCRVFAAAGVEAGGEDKAVINRRVREWRFRFSSAADLQAYLAIKAAAAFIGGQYAHFPRGAAPRNALGIAALALRVYPVFLPPGPPQTAPETADAILAASAAFDRRTGARS